MDTQNKEQGKAALHLTINGKVYEWHQEYITGAEIRKLGNITAEDEIFLAIKKPWEDEPIPDDKQVNLARPEIEHFYSISKHFKVELIVNGRQKTWNENTISFEQVVILAFGNYDASPERVFTVTFDRGPQDNPEGTMVRGERVYVKNKMIFNVTATSKS